MAQRTSDRNNEPQRAEPVDADFDRMFGVNDRRPGKCETHGDFVDVHFSGEKGPAQGWSGCPECSKQESEKRQRQEEIRRLYEHHRRHCQIPYRFQDASFETFDPPSDKAKRHAQKIRQYANEIVKRENDGQSLILFGKVGTGKTHLTCAALDLVMREGGQSARYYSFSELIREVKRTFNPNEPGSEEDVYRRFVSPALVALDEIGVQNFTEFEQSVAYEAINARYVEGKPTMLATNLPIKELPECLGDRAVDRLREGGGRALDFDWKSNRAGGGS